MSIFEYNEEEEMKKIRAAQYSLGEEAGIVKGMEQGIAKGKAEDILELLKDLGSIPDELRDRILAETNLELLRVWLRKAAKAESLQVFLKQTGLV